MDREDEILNYVQKQLSAEDTARFEAAMAADKNLAAEVAVLQAARGALGQTDEAAQDSAWDRLSRRIDQDRFQPANANSPIRLSLVQTACAVIAAVGLWQLVAVPYMTSESAQYSTASETADGPALQLRFEPNAPISEISALLYELGARLTDGPSALGLYRVQFADEASRDAATTMLREAPNIVVEITLE